MGASCRVGFWKRPTYPGWLGAGNRYFPNEQPRPGFPFTEYGEVNVNPG